jgi:hypothetical protein
MFKNLLNWFFSIWMAVFLALLYGIVAFFFFRHPSPAWKNIFTVMTLAYIFLVPFVIGCITVYFGELKRRRSWVFRILMPWVPVALLVGLALIFAWEGAICIIMIMPSFFIMASLGGLLYAIVKDNCRNRLNGFVFAAVLLLPFLSAPVESRFPSPSDYRQVQTTIEISAPPEAVWPNIIEVRKFQPWEHHFSWVHTIGFPRPVEATLSHPGVGGIRRASFEGNVLFLETIDWWEPNRGLSFNIASDPDSIPQTTLDEHVTVGGPYFDVLKGKYEIEPLGPGRVRLHLTSSYRITTPFNFYSGLWTDFVMRDIQNYILGILKQRSETAVHARI